VDATAKALVTFMDLRLLVLIATLLAFVTVAPLAILALNY